MSINNKKGALFQHDLAVKLTNFGKNTSKVNAIVAHNV